jgi:hypothetical protein
VPIHHTFTVLLMVHGWFTLRFGSALVTCTLHTGYLHTHIFSPWVYTHTRTCYPPVYTHLVTFVVYPTQTVGPHTDGRLHGAPRLDDGYGRVGCFAWFAGGLVGYSPTFPTFTPITHRRFPTLPTPTYPPFPPQFHRWFG